MISTAIVTLLITSIALAIKQILFAIGKGLCWIVGFLNDVFEMIAGLNPITYTGSGHAESTQLIKVFFGNTNINTIYWGMALIGIVMCFGFAIVAVIKKGMDDGDKMKQSMGGILRNTFKGITLILLMNFILSATISLSSTLLDRINYLMLNAYKFDLSYDVTFDSEDYAAMARCLNTIGNYSLNTSYNSRYNINSCYNSIRKDLKQLGEKGKFDVTYISTTYDEDGNQQVVNTWQSVLQAIYRSTEDIDAAQPLDSYDSKIAESILSAMDIVKNDASFAALEKYRVNQTSKQVGEAVKLDRMIMLIGSMNNRDVVSGNKGGMTDYLRGPYYYGQKDVFSYSQVSRDFDMGLGTWLYLTVIIIAFMFVKDMLAMAFNATARIFNMLLLYISAPPFIAVTPLDDGGKLKQWTTAFIIQSAGLFGTVISMRLVMLFIPVLFSGEIQFFSSVKADTFARVIVMYGALFTARKASGMIVGILADNAGWQAISAGDVGNEAKGAVDMGVGTARRVGGFAVGLAKKGLGKLDSLVEKKKGPGEGGGGAANAAKSAAQIPASLAQNALEMGSQSNSSTNTSSNSSQTTPKRSTVASVGANGNGTIGSGSFQTGNSGSARDFESKNRVKLEPVQPIGSKNNSDFQSTNRPNLKNTGSNKEANKDYQSRKRPTLESLDEPVNSQAPAQQGSVDAAGGNLPGNNNQLAAQPNAAQGNNAQVNGPAAQPAPAQPAPAQQGSADAAGGGSLPGNNNQLAAQPDAAQGNNSQANGPAAQPVPAQPNPAQGNNSQANSSAAQPGKHLNQNNKNRMVGRSRTFEDSAVSERRNRSIPGSLRKIK